MHYSTSFFWTIEIQQRHPRFCFCYIFLTSKFCTVKHNFNYWFTKAIFTCRKGLLYNTEMPYTDKKTASASCISAMM